MSFRQSALGTVRVKKVKLRDANEIMEVRRLSRQVAVLTVFDYK